MRSRKLKKHERIVIKVHYFLYLVLKYKDERQFKIIKIILRLIWDKHCKYRGAKTIECYKSMEYQTSILGFVNKP